MSAGAGTGGVGVGIVPRVVVVLVRSAVAVVVVLTGCRTLAQAGAAAILAAPTATQALNNALAHVANR